MRIPDIIISAAALLVASTVIAQIQPPPRPSSASAPTPIAYPTSITLAQIAERQEQNYARIRNAQGEMLWTEQHYENGTTTRSARIVFFAFEGDRSVNLIISASGSQFPSRSETIDWSRVLAAYFVEGDMAYHIVKPPKASVPKVESLPFNPAVHDRNPLVSYRPRMMGDDRARLWDLAKLVPQMPTPPQIRQFESGGRTLLQIDFTNATTPGESLTYVIAPDKGYLAQEIIRVAGGKIAARTSITIGQTKDGTWIPAVRDRKEYDATGRVTSREIWLYRYLAINEPLPRHMLSFEFFHLPQATEIPTPVGATPVVTPTPTLRPSQRTPITVRRE